MVIHSPQEVEVVQVLSEETHHHLHKQELVEQVQIFQLGLQQHQLVMADIMLEAVVAVFQGVAVAILEAVQVVRLVQAEAELEVLVVQDNLLEMLILAVAAVLVVIVVVVITTHKMVVQELL